MTLRKCPRDPGALGHALRTTVLAELHMASTLCTAWSALDHMLIAEGKEEPHYLPLLPVLCLRHLHGSHRTGHQASHLFLTVRLKAV